MAKNKKEFRSRIFMITQYEVNPKTGESLNFTEKNITDGITIKKKNLLKWAYIKHDKDTYLNEEEIPNNKQVGDNKPLHWHVVLHFKNGVTIKNVAETFGVKENYVRVLNGRNSFYDAIQYLTHEDDKQQELGKYKYDREDVVFEDDEVATLCWNGVDDLVIKKANSLPDKNKVKIMLERLVNGTYDLGDVYEKDKILYNENEAVFKRARRNYLKYKEMPVVRTNYYITGQGGSGKTVAAKAMARSLMPGIPDDKLYFVVGDGKVAFDDYDGQPIVIWDDWRSSMLLDKFDRGTVWKLFAINPDKISLSVKYGDVTVSNTINIVTSVQSFNDFIEGLAGEYIANGVKYSGEDAGQGYRRFPVFVEVTKRSLDIYISNSLTGGEMETYKRVVGIETSMIEYAKNECIENTKKVMQPIKKIHNEIEKRNGSVEDKKPKLIDVKIDYTDEYKEIFGDDEDEES